MIYIVLKGGLGNQLFQFGAALRQAKGDIDKIRLAFQIGHENSYRLSDLFDQKFLPAVITEEEVIKLQDEKNNVIFITDHSENAFVDQPHLDIELQNDKNYLLDGYFQSGKNLLALKNYIKTNQINFKQPQNLRLIEPSELVAHYRLGDYAKPDVQNAIGILDIGYLDKIISSEIDRSQKLTIFTDDVFFEKKYPKIDNINIVVGGNDIEVFHAFLNATTLITANSSFSLCAGLLSDKNQRLYRPAFWTRNILCDDLCLGFEDKSIYLIPNSFY